MPDKSVLGLMLDAGPVLLDGGMGSMLIAAGPTGLLAGRSLSHRPGNTWLNSSCLAWK